MTKYTLNMVLITAGTRRYRKINAKIMCDTLQNVRQGLDRLKRTFTGPEPWEIMDGIEDNLKVLEKFCRAGK